jgi:hypothetical protein
MERTEKCRIAPRSTKAQQQSAEVVEITDLPGAVAPQFMKLYSDPGASSGVGTGCGVHDQLGDGTAIARRQLVPTPGKVGWQGLDAFPGGPICEMKVGRTPQVRGVSGLHEPSQWQGHGVAHGISKRLTGGGGRRVPDTLDVVVAIGDSPLIDTLGTMGPTHAGSLAYGGVTSFTVSTRRIERRLRQVGDRLRALREELRIIDEQYTHLADEADDMEIRALVAETPAAGLDYRDAKRHAEAMGRHRADVLAAIAELEARQDQLLDRLVG